MTTRMMIDQSAERARDEERATATAPTPRTQYAIRATSCGLYAGANMHWVELAHALRFDFMTTAIAFAIELGYTLDEFTVDAI